MITKEKLHGLINVLPQDEVDFIYHMLLKCVPESPAFEDEVDSFKRAEIEIYHGDYTRLEDFEWEF